MQGAIFDASGRQEYGSGSVDWFFIKVFTRGVLPMEQAIAPQIGANGGYLSYNDCVTIRIIIYLDTARRTGKGSVSV